MFSFCRLDFDVIDFHPVDTFAEIDESEEYVNHLPTRLSCFIHSLQLCIRDGLRKAPFIPKVLAKCQSFAKYAHKSSKISEYLDSLKKHIHKMNVTRWGSDYLLIKTILSLGKSDVDAISSMMDSPIKFINQDWTIIDELILILEPFYDISIRCQVETAVSASLVVPSITHLLNHLSAMKECFSSSLKLVQQLSVAIETRFAGIVCQLYQRNIAPDAAFQDPVYFIAAVLDPEFKFYWLRDLRLVASDENRLKQHIIQLIVDELSKYEIRSSVGTTLPVEQLSTVSSSLSQPNVKRKKLFHYHDDAENSDATTKNDPTIELQAYLNDPIKSSFTDFWYHSRLKLLKSLVTRMFSVQASSAPIERAFSHAGLIYSCRRTNMREGLFRNLVFLRVNRALL